MAKVSIVLNDFSIEKNFELHRVPCKNEKVRHDEGDHKSVYYTNIFDVRDVIHHVNRREADSVAEIHLSSDHGISYSDRVFAKNSAVL